MKSRRKKNNLSQARLYFKEISDADAIGPDLASLTIVEGHMRSA